MYIVFFEKNTHFVRMYDRYILLVFDSSTSTDRERCHEVVSSRTRSWWEFENVTVAYISSYYFFYFSWSQGHRGKLFVQSKHYWRTLRCPLYVSFWPRRTISTKYQLPRSRCARTCQLYLQPGNNLKICAQHPWQNLSSFDSLASEFTPGEVISTIFSPWMPLAKAAICALDQLCLVQELLVLVSNSLEPLTKWDFPTMMISLLHLNLAEPCCIQLTGACRHQNMVKQCNGMR